MHEEAMIWFFINDKTMLFKNIGASGIPAALLLFVDSAAHKITCRTSMRLSISYVNLRMFPFGWLARAVAPSPSPTSLSPLSSDRMAWY
jgi:hypothetical protein